MKRDTSIISSSSWSSSPKSKQKRHRSIRPVGFGLKKRPMDGNTWTPERDAFLLHFFVRVASGLETMFLQDPSWESWDVFTTEMNNFIHTSFTTSDVIKRGKHQRQYLKRFQKKSGSTACSELEYTNMLLKIWGHRAIRFPQESSVSGGAASGGAASGGGASSSAAEPWVTALRASLAALVRAGLLTFQESVAIVPYLFPNEHVTSMFMLVEDAHERASIVRGYLQNMGGTITTTTTTNHSNHHNNM